MRASAPSQTITPANIPAPQAKTDVNKADAASPFALLMEATAKDPAKAVKKDAKESSDKQVDGVRRNDAARNDKVATAQTNPKPAAPAKGAKPGPDKDKNDNAIRADKDVPDDKQVATAEPQTPDQQALPPAVPASAIVSADPVTETPEDIAIDGAAPMAKAEAPSAGMPASSPDLPQSDSANVPAEPATDEASPLQAQLAAPPDQADEVETAETVAAHAAQPVIAPADAKPGITTNDTAKDIVKDTGKPVAVKTAAKSGDPAKPETAGIDVAQDDLTSTDTVRENGETLPSGEAKPAKADIVKDENANGESLKGHAAHTTVADNAKPAAPESQKADAPRADVHPVEPDSVPAAAKPAPQSATVSNAAFAINTIAAPQAAQHSQAPIATQHVQVTAQPAPNVPALAVEIAAKSQSGARQFDIRLDPPELGRVEVRLSIDATGKASAHLSADQPQTLHLLQKDAPILTRALREAGLDVSQDGLNFSLRQQASGQNGNDGNNGRFAGSRAFSLAASASIDPTAAVIAYQGLADGRVDIRV